VVVTCETNNDFSVPNAFTPNGDNNNDEFCLRGWNECTSDFRILIFDRWGEKIFESQNPSFCWDGIYKGQALNAGVFVYVLQAKKSNGDLLEKKGNITLIR
jgi:gliding motility-associated-like protein